MVMIYTPYWSFAFTPRHMKNDFKMLQGPKKIKIRMPQYSHGAWTAKFLYFKYHLSDEELNKKKNQTIHLYFIWR